MGGAHVGGGGRGAAEGQGLRLDGVADAVGADGEGLGGGAADDGAAAEADAVGVVSDGLRMGRKGDELV